MNTFVHIHISTHAHIYECARVLFSVVAYLHGVVESFITFFLKFRDSYTKMRTLTSGRGVVVYMIP